MIILPRVLHTYQTEVSAIDFSRYSNNTGFSICAGRESEAKSKNKKKHCFIGRMSQLYINVFRPCTACK